MLAEPRWVSNKHFSSVVVTVTQMPLLLFLFLVLVMMLLLLHGVFNITFTLGAYIIHKSLEFDTNLLNIFTNILMLNSFESLVCMQHSNSNINAMILIHCIRSSWNFFFLPKQSQRSFDSTEKKANHAKIFWVASLNCYLGFVTKLLHNTTYNVM